MLVRKYQPGNGFGAGNAPAVGLAACQGIWRQQRLVKNDRQRGYTEWHPQKPNAESFEVANMRARVVFFASILTLIFAPAGNGQCKDSVVGTWKLVSVTSKTEKGDVNSAVLGRNPSGLLTYTEDGRMMAIISDDGRKPLSIADRVAAPAEERAEAYSTFMAYAGRYTFTCDKIVHHVEVASLQNWVNTDQTRFISLQGKRLIVRNTPQMRGGMVVTLESVWERLKQ